MPMLDAYIPEGALSAEAEGKLLARLTDLLLEHEGVDPANQAARALAWVFVHRPAVYVGGLAAAEPRYRFVCQVPEGQYNSKRRQAVTAAMTQAVADAEAGSRPDPAGRVWVFTFEVPDGTWGGFGQVIRLPDIAERVLGPDMRAPAQKWLAARQRKKAAALVEIAGTGVPGRVPAKSRGCSSRVRNCWPAVSWRPAGCNESLPAYRGALAGDQTCWMVL